ncbi:MAG TPA: membrane protein insertase YidC [bacterium]|nr:membrane protein insertase YidC [bacterium]
MDKQSILAFVVIFLILIAMPFYYQLIDYNQSEQAPQDSAQTVTQDTLKQPEPSPEPQETSPEIEQAQDTHPESLVKESRPEKILTVENKYYKFDISSIGGGTVKNFILKKYHEYNDEDTTFVNLVKDPDQRPLKIKYNSISKERSVILDNNFEIVKSSRLLSDSSIFLNEDESFSVTYAYKKSGKNLVTKTFTFHGDEYRFDLVTDMTGLLKDIAGNEFQVTWLGGLSYTENKLEKENNYAKAYAFTAAEEVDKFDIKQGETDQREFQGNTLWTAIRSKYFTAAFIPDKSADKYTLKAATVQSGETFKKIFDMEITYAANQRQKTSLFIGPLKYDVVKGLNADLQQIMNLGSILKFISRPLCTGILITLNTLYNFIPNYGIVIIIFAVFIKIILSPLTMKSMKSMKEMQLLQPKIQELKEEYEDDQQKLNKKTMALYQDYGINPMGGCFPILLQMPILISMFTVIRSTIALRHAEFIFWITDLSSPDMLFTLPFTIPFYGQYFNLLPIIMVITQILQQKLSGSSSNPQQKSMAYVMPIVFFFIFNKFPSGLVLYYTCFNIFTVIQTKYFTPEPKLTKSKKKKKKGRLARMEEMRKKMNK